MLKQEDIDNIKSAALGTTKDTKFGKIVVNRYATPDDTLLLIKEIERLRNVIVDLNGQLEYERRAISKLPQSYQDDITDYLAENKDNR